MKLFVHDYFIDYLGSNEAGPDVCCSITVQYSLNKKEDDHSVYLKSFVAYAGTPSGIGKYLNFYLDLAKKTGNYSNILFFRPIIVVETFNGRELYLYIKQHLESLTGRTESELIIRAMQDLDWVHDDPTIDDNISHLLYRKQ